MNSMQTVNSKKYIEIDSTYRNRNEYPFQAQFKINVGNAGQTIGLNNAKDPVTDGTSEWVWRSINDLVSNGITIDLIMDGVPSAVNWLNTGVFTNINSERPGRGYFVKDNTTGEIVLVDNIVLSNNFVEGPTLVFETPFSDTWATGGQFDFLTYEDTTHVYFPFADQQDNAFNGWTLTRIGGTQNTTVTEPVTVSAFSEKFRMMTVSTGLTSNARSDIFNLSKEPIVIGGVTPAAGTWTGRTAELPATASAVDDIYNGRIIKFIDISSGVNGQIMPTYYTVIEDYNGTTKVATLRDPVPNYTAGFRGFTISDFTEDAASFLNVGNSYENKRTLYKVNLNNLILPNQIVDSPKGGRIAFYPYVYVVLSNTSIGTSSLMNSNNPNSNSAVFRCPIGDTDNPETATFIKVRSDQIQTFEFNIYEDIKFEVYLPDGTLFRTLLLDTISPIPPNPNYQISAAFSFELPF